MAFTQNLFGIKTPSGNGTANLPIETRSATGTISIVDATQTETTEFNVLDLVPATGSPMMDVKVYLDLNAATTGFGAVETTATVGFGAARKIDGTNWRREPYKESVLSGTLAAVAPGRSWVVELGDVDVAGAARIYADFSADITSSITIPYRVTYKSRSAATITPLAA